MARRDADLDAECAPEAVLDAYGESVAPSEPTHAPFVGFAAGLLSGWTKLVVGHPFDTIKTRCESFTPFPPSPLSPFPLGLN